MCERYGKLPSEIYREDAELVRLQILEAMGKVEEAG